MTSLETAEQIARRGDGYVTSLGPAGFATTDNAEALEFCQRLQDVARAGMVGISNEMTREASMFDEPQMRTFWRPWASRTTWNGAAEEVAGVETLYLMGALAAAAV